MLKKLVVLIMAFSIFSVQAHASTIDGLQAAFNELNYSLSVEWDQQDKNFYDSQMKDFTDTIRNLQDEGLSNSQLINFSKSKVKNAQIAKDLETAANMIQINNMTRAEATKYMMDSMKNSYSTGASWNGEVLIPLIVIAVIVAIVVSITSTSTSTYNGSNTGNTQNCYYEEVYLCNNSCDDVPYSRCAKDCRYTTQYNCY
jgi:hypothetical protein